MSASGIEENIPLLRSHLNRKLNPNEGNSLLQRSRRSLRNRSTRIELKTRTNTKKSIFHFLPRNKVIEGSLRSNSYRSSKCSLPSRICRSFSTSELEISRPKGNSSQSLLQNHDNSKFLASKRKQQKHNSIECLKSEPERFKMLVSAKPSIASASMTLSTKKFYRQNTPLPTPLALLSKSKNIPNVTTSISHHSPSSSSTLSKNCYVYKRKPTVLLKQCDLITKTDKTSSFDLNIVNNTQKSLHCVSAENDFLDSSPYSKLASASQTQNSEPISELSTANIILNSSFDYSLKKTVEEDKNFFTLKTVNTENLISSDKKNLTNGSVVSTKCNSVKLSSNSFYTSNSSLEGKDNICKTSDLLNSNLSIVLNSANKLNDLYTTDICNHNKERFSLPITKELNLDSTSSSNKSLQSITSTSSSETSTVVSKTISDTMLLLQNKSKFSQSDTQLKTNDSFPGDFTTNSTTSPVDLNNSSFNCTHHKNICTLCSSTITTCLNLFTNVLSQNVPSKSHALPTFSNSNFCVSTLSFDKPASVSSCISASASNSLSLNRSSFLQISLNSFISQPDSISSTASILTPSDHNHLTGYLSPLVSTTSLENLISSTAPSYNSSSSVVCMWDGCNASILSYNLLAHLRNQHLAPQLQNSNFLVATRKKIKKYSTGFAKSDTHFIPLHGGSPVTYQKVSTSNSEKLIHMPQLNLNKPFTKSWSAESLRDSEAESLTQNSPTFSSTYESLKFPSSKMNIVSSCLASSTSSLSTSSNKYKCQWRGCKVFGRESSSAEWLERHVLKHSGDLPFCCIVDSCGRRFSTQLSLQRHVNSHFKQNFSINSNGHHSNQFGKTFCTLPTSSIHTSTANKKSCDLTLVKSSKRRRLKRRTLHPVKTPDDFFDARTMQCLQNKLIRFVTDSGIDLNKNGNLCQNTFSLQSSVIACRKDASGDTQLLIRWTPNIIPDIWVSTSNAQSTISNLSIRKLSYMSNACDLFSSCLYNSKKKRRK